MTRSFGKSAALAAILCAGISAQSTVVHADFTFRRVGVPDGAATNRITVQIDPTIPQPSAPSTGSVIEGSQVASASAEIPAEGNILEEVLAAVRPPVSGFEWFWDTVSPALAESGPGRLEIALNLIANPPGGDGVAAPRLQDLQEIARLHGQDILRATVGTKVSPALALAIIAVESSGRSDAQSSAGAQGLMQLMPATAERFGVDDRLITTENIRGGVAYLDWLMGHFDHDPILVLAGYNAGEGSVRDNFGVPPFAETRAYVPKVLAAFAVARGLCQTPPVLVSDGCVFTVNNL